MISRPLLSLKSPFKFHLSIRSSLATFTIACALASSIYLFAQPAWVRANSGDVSGLRRLAVMLQTNTQGLAKALRPASTVQQSAQVSTMANADSVHAETFVPDAPTRLLIDAIDLDAPVVSIGWSAVTVDGKITSQWDVPDWAAAGWLKTSARVGEVGNTVLVGHQNIDGKVFRALEFVDVGDAIQVMAGEQTRNYHVTQILILPEKGQPLEVRRANARWIAHTDDERLTLVTCWPRNSDTHRLIVVAAPDEAEVDP